MVKFYLKHTTWQLPDHVHVVTSGCSVSNFNLQSSFLACVTEWTLKWQCVFYDGEIAFVITHGAGFDFLVDYDGDKGVSMCAVQF